ncbi:MAG TPA: hypothetical protein PLQ81_05730, partial [bacterium]|nr:hypothetical protein [bacterium]
MIQDNKSENNNQSANWNFIKPYIFQYKKLIIVSIIFMLLFSLTSPLQLWILKPFVDHLFQKNNAETSEFRVSGKTINKIRETSKKFYLSKIFPLQVKNEIKTKLTRGYRIDKKNIFIFISVYLIAISFLKGFFKFCHSFTLIYAV